MVLDELKRLVANGEGETVEVKETTFRRPDWTGSRTIQRTPKTLQETGRIRRLGGTRGKWEVM